MTLLLKVTPVDIKLSNIGTHVHTQDGMCLQSTSARPSYIDIDKHSMPLTGLSRVLILG